MPHHHFDSLTGKDQLFREFMPDRSIINIAVHSFEWFERLQLFCYGRAKISRMPDLITVCKMTENGFIEVAMCVGNQADAGHGIKIKENNGPISPVFSQILTLQMRKSFDFEDLFRLI